MLVPGFTQTASSWDAVLAALRTDRPGTDATAVDVTLGVDFVDTATRLGEQHGPAVYVGYSMGGRLCLQLALDRPALVRGLVLVSASPGLRDAAARAERRAADELLARAVEHEGVEPFLDRWLAQPLFASVPPDASGLADRRTLSAAHLAGCLRVLGTGVMPPLWDRLGDLRVPVLLMTGTRDDKFDTIAAEMEAAIPGARHLRIESGHALPLERPRALAHALAAFATKVPGDG